MEHTLEKEFEDFKIIHKSAIVKAVAMRYYSDLYDSEVNLPECIKSKEDFVDRQVNTYMDALMLDMNEFEKIYNNCWNEVGRYLP